MTFASSLSAIVLSLALASMTRADAAFRNCDDAQTGEITLAYLTAVGFLDAAKKELNSIRKGGDRSRFEAWFGYVTEERLSYVEALVDAAYVGGIGKASYVCGISARCNDNFPDTRAWTEHGSAIDNVYGVYVCQRFYAESVVDQTGILIHEFSHLYGTRDFTDEELKGKGELKTTEDWRRMAREFAMSHPKETVFIAYNFGFFVMDR